MAALLKTTILNGHEHVAVFDPPTGVVLWRPVLSNAFGGVGYYQTDNRWMPLTRVVEQQPPAPPPAAPPFPEEATPHQD